MIDNPFAVLERRINRLEVLLLEIKAAATEPAKEKELRDRCTLEEAVEITGYSKSKLYKLTGSNLIPHKRFGNRLIFSRKDLQVWIDAQTIDCTDSKSNTVLRLAAEARRKGKGGKYANA